METTEPNDAKSVEKINGKIQGGEIQLSDEAIDDAKEFAQKSEIERPINRTPSVVAASSLYLASAINEDGITQSDIANQFGVSEVAIREAYREIADYEQKESYLNEYGKYLPDEAPNPPDNPILEKFAWRKMWLEDNNALWAVVGDTGDGKSMASIRIGEVLDPNFTIEDNVASNILEFIQMATNKEKYGQGSVIVLEEGSVEASSLDWHSKSNRIFAKILDTWRHQNRMGIINLPNFMALEKGARRRTKAIIKMQHAAPWRDYSQGKFYKSKYGNIEDKFTTPFPVVDGKERRYLRFKMPSEELVETYEAQKEEYTDELNEELLEELIAEQEEETAQEQQPKEIAEEILAEDRLEEYVSDNNGQKYIDRSLIELDYEIGERKGKKVKKAIQRNTERESLQ